MIDNIKASISQVGYGPTILVLSFLGAIILGIIPDKECAEGEHPCIRMVEIMLAIFSAISFAGGLVASVVEITEAMEKKLS